MKRNSFQKLQELSLFREKEGGAGGGMRTGRRKCPCARQSGNTCNDAFSNTACAVYLNQAEGRKNCRIYRRSSKPWPGRVIGTINRWTVGSKERDSCATKSVGRSIEQTERCRHV